MIVSDRHEGPASCGFLAFLSWRRDAERMPYAWDSKAVALQGAAAAGTWPNPRQPASFEKALVSLMAYLNFSDDFPDRDYSEILSGFAAQHKANAHAEEPQNYWCSERNTVYCRDYNVRSVRCI